MKLTELFLAEWIAKRSANAAPSNACRTPR